MAETGAPKQREVVLAVDRSPGSELAFRWALDNLLKPTDKAVALFAQEAAYHDQYPTLDAAAPIPADYFGDLGTFIPENVRVELEKKATAEGAKVLEKYLKMAADCKIPCEGEVVRGDPRDKIIQVAEHNKADMLVVGSRGLGAVKRTFVGSVSDFCAHHSPCPVVIIRSDMTVKKPADISVADGSPQRKVLLAVDGSDRSAYAFTWALKNVLRSGDKAVVVSVIEWVPTAQPFVGFGTEVGVAEAYVMDPQSAASLDKAHVGQAQTLLDRYAKAAADAKVECETRVVKGEVRDRICDEAERIAADLLVVGCRGLGAIKRALLGSTSDYCAHHSPCPLIIVRTPETITSAHLPEALQVPKKIT